MGLGVHARRLGLRVGVTAAAFAVLACLGGCGGGGGPVVARVGGARFAIPETRVVDLIENLPSRAAARALVRRIGTGRAFTRRGYHEVLERGAVSTTGVPGKAALVRAIFSAHVGALVGPMPLNHAWTVFVVRRIVPGATPAPKSAGSPPAGEG